MTSWDQDVKRKWCSGGRFIMFIYIIVKLRLGSGTQAQSGSVRLKLRHEGGVPHKNPKSKTY